MITCQQRLRVARRERPFSLTFGVALLPPGVLALIYGDEVSQALSNISAGVVSRSVGALFVVGCLMTLVGIARGKHVIELTGLVVMAVGALIYGFGVVLGLGLAGSVAGSGFLGIGIAGVLRVFSLATVAVETARDEP